jgi:hypothetical protein
MHKPPYYLAKRVFLKATLIFLGPLRIYTSSLSITEERRVSSDSPNHRQSHRDAPQYACNHIPLCWEELLLPGVTVSDGLTRLPDLGPDCFVTLPFLSALCCTVESEFRLECTVIYQFPAIASMKVFFLECIMQLNSQNNVVQEGLMSAYDLV